MILGAVLAGGLSRRFGADKAMVQWRGRTLLSHAVDVLTPHVDTVVVLGGDRICPSLENVGDWPSPGLGPIGGLCGALRYARLNGFDSVLTTACDMPLVPAALFHRLVEAGGPISVRAFPVIGHWPVAYVEALTAHILMSSDRSMMTWISHIGGVQVAAGCDLPNINRPTDFADLPAAPMA